MAEQMTFDFGQANEVKEDDKLLRMKELIKILNEASKAYYQQDKEIMSNFEYDALYDELLKLEAETGITYSDSPSIHVGYEVISELEKERHPSPMLSLDKTKDVDALASWLGDQKGLLSWKMDGLTVVLTYENGELVKAVTRGDGEVGEVITNNAKMFCNIPGKISYKGQLIIRGEAVITYSDFEKINAQIEDVDAKYKNPRNLCSGSVRQLNNKITKERNVHFFAFNLVDVEDVDFHNSIKERYEWLKKMGFTVVEYKEVTKDTVADTVAWFSEKIKTNDFPSDGLVIIYDDIEYGISLGRTAKFPRNAMAFKWQDETAVTHLQYIEWSASRTGLINPVAVFDTVELEGTSVSRASVHNVSVMQDLKLGIGDEIVVYKANMIIPQIAENITGSNNIEIPKECPVCGGETEIKAANGIKSLYCTNPYCSAKKVKLFAHFASRNAMNIDGLSEQTCEKLIDEGILSELPDLFALERHEAHIVSLEGFGKKSYDKLIAAIEVAKKTELYRLIYGLGIANIGVANAKLVCKHYKNDITALRTAKIEEVAEIEGFGEIMAQGFVHYFANPKNNEILDQLLAHLEFVVEEQSENQSLEGKVFVVTGSVTHFANRDELKDFIEKRGGKVTGSVSAKTDYLINNDVTSNSSKNKKAKTLGIPILSEEDFLALVGE